ncbi:hypothetical protein BJ170DRAFT_601482 [Xylariales sp. AK1849]|nr:hypothetical protein BJ170DRAFT_601482 [Xylariales sp. AK1849]
MMRLTIAMTLALAATFAASTPAGMVEHTVAGPNGADITFYAQNPKAVNSLDQTPKLAGRWVANWHDTPDSGQTRCTTASTSNFTGGADAMDCFMLEVFFKDSLPGYWDIHDWGAGVWTSMLSYKTCSLYLMRGRDASEIQFGNLDAFNYIDDTLAKYNGAGNVGSNGQTYCVDNSTGGQMTAKVMLGIWKTQQPLDRT